MSVQQLSSGRSSRTAPRGTLSYFAYLLACLPEDFKMAKELKPLADLVIARYPVRTCRSLHHCEICGRDIVLGEQYHDGGYGRRIHVRCTSKHGFDKQGARLPEAQEKV